VDNCEDVTALVRKLGSGDRDVLDRLLPLVYDELKVLARRHRYRWRGEHTPGTLSLVHEAYLKLADQTRVDWQCRAQFFYLASLAMRHILVDNARRFQRRKRVGAEASLDGLTLVSRERSAELLALDDALDRLKARDDRLGRIVECRFFGGLTIEETAEAVGASPATVKRGWDEARARLYQDLHGNGTS
jgi:RNA polymerase sigma factor (TIGR02999 family)